MNEKELLDYWIKRLRLQDWTIKLETNCKPSEMILDDCVGCTDWIESNKSALVQIIDPKYYGKRIVPFNFEKTLVHELLHLKMTFWCQEDKIEDRVMHQIIDDLAKAFTEKESNKN